MIDVARVREDFPILGRTVHGRPLVYLDSAATSQKPRAVIDTIARFYTDDCAAVHRGLHQLTERATAEFEGARQKVRRFLGAREGREIVFVRGTTEAINLVARSFVVPSLAAGDEVVVTAMEHHANLVPWQTVCAERGAALRVAPVTERGEIEADAFERLLGPRTRFVAVTHVSNVLGTVNPVGRLVERAHRHGARVLVDVAHAAPHLPVDVAALGCDFYAFSGHKLYAPFGIGVLYGKATLLDAMPPWQLGGEMVASVGFERATFRESPHRFEAGTPNVEGVVGLGAAIDYLGRLGLEAIGAHERDLLAHATRVLAEVPRLRLVGAAAEKIGILSFVVDGVHAHDLGTVLDREGIAIRTGHLCAQPLVERFGVPAVARASLALYNTREEIDALGRALRRAVELLG